MNSVTLRPAAMSLLQRQSLLQSRTRLGRYGESLRICKPEYFKDSATTKALRWMSSSSSPIIPPPPQSSEGSNFWKKLTVGGLIGSLAGLIVATRFRDNDWYHYACDHLGMPLVRLLDPEQAHNLTIKAVWWRLSPNDYLTDDEILKTSVWGLNFSNPVGLAAGFDKHGEAIDNLFNLGFGLVEIGSVTPLPQDRAVINRYGFNSEGQEIVAARLDEREIFLRNLGENYYNRNRGGILGVNLGKNKTSTDAVQDYVLGVQNLSRFADYLVINVSSPNTPGLRALQGKDELRSLLTAVKKALDSQDWSNKRRPPLLLKIAPDLVTEDKKDIASVSVEVGIDGLIVSNTTISRPSTLQSANRVEAGGLSGAPLKGLALQTLRDMYRLVDGKVPLIGVGGIETGKDAYERIRAGASLVQLYSGLVYSGPGAVRKVKQELASLLKQDGFTSVAQAVGVDSQISPVANKQKLS